MSGSDYTVTPNYGLIKPVPNADNDVWGDHLNSNSDTLDGLLKTIQNTSGVTSFNTRTGAVTLNTADVTTVLPPSAGTPAMDGTPTPGAVNTWSRGDHVHPTDTTRYAASNPAGYVTAAGAAGASPVQSFNTRTGAIVLNTADVTTVLPPSSTPPAMNGTVAVGTGTTWARADHVHPSDTARAPLASPVFTGDPQAPTAAAGDNDTSVATTAFVSAAVGTALHDVGRNLLHNSMFNIAQRGAGAWTLNGYTLDRWRMDLALDTFAINQQQYNDAQRAIIGDEEANNALIAVVTGNAGATAFSLLSQTMESARKLSGKTIAVSFWAHAVAGTPKVGVGIRQSFGTGGSPSAVVDVNAVAVTLSTTPTRYIVTIPVPSVAGKTFGTSLDHSTRLGLFLSAGANTNTIAGGIGVQSATFVFWGVQLEIGPVATPLEKPDPQQDLAKCQRFFQVGQQIQAGYGSAGNVVVYASTNLPVTMRAPPTLVITPNGNANASATTGGPYNNTSIYFQANVVATGNAVFGCTYTASADL